MARSELSFWFILMVMGWVVAHGQNAPQSSASDEESAVFLGVETCGTCHQHERLGNQFRAWTGSAHARAYLVLNTGYEQAIEPEARGLVDAGAGQAIAEKALKLGQDQVCATCHGTALALDDTRCETGFHMEDGVQCETCHGPGRGYVTWMRVWFDADEADVERRPQPDMPSLDACMVCHKTKASHAALGRTAFAPERAWPRVAHPLPKDPEP